MSTPTANIPLGMPSFGQGNLNLTEPFPRSAREQLQNSQMRANIHHATHTIRAKRANVVSELPDWQDLRSSGSALKTHVGANMSELLLEFEKNFTARGGTVHWARDAEEANRIVTELIRQTGSNDVIKVKSMATQEIGLDAYLEERGITATETDLAELIVQLGHDKPSHILVPAIHRNRDEIRDIFIKEMPETDDSLTNRPRDLAEAARTHLREKFLSTKVAVSGANFGVAETGTLTVVESEGNGRMCLTLPETLITVMGIEKLVPTFKDLEVFLQLLPRSSTGERMNPYTSMWTGVTPNDGPQDVHVVLLDNGRTAVLDDPAGRSALHCIRCSACLNVCPVYEHAGGHAYGSTYPGPIGAILSPQLTGIESEYNATLPFASSLCGACYEVCPVKINIPDILLHLRQKAVEAEDHKIPSQMDLLMKAVSMLFASGMRMSLVERGLPLGVVLAAMGGGIKWLPGVVGGWTQERVIPAPPKQSFRNWWKQHEHETAERLAQDSALEKEV